MQIKRIFTFFLAFLIPVLFAAGCAKGGEEKTLDYACNYLGKTLEEIEETWGEDHTTGGVFIPGQDEGLCYADNRTPYIFFFGEEKGLPAGKEDTVTMVRVAGGAGEISSKVIGEEPRKVLNRRFPQNRSSDSVKLDATIITFNDEENNIRVAFMWSNAAMKDNKKPPNSIEVQRIPH